MIVKARKLKQTFFTNQSTIYLMVGMFLNPMGFDVVQYSLIELTGSLWYANFVLYCLAGLFFGLSFLSRKR